MSFFEELKRRNVIRVGIAYVIVAWLVLQFADVVLNNIAAPGWVFKVIMLVLVIGLPVVLIFAWAFEVTPEGIKKETDVDRSQSITNVTGQKLNYTIIGLLVLALAYFIWQNQKGPTSISAPGTAVTTNAGDQKLNPAPGNVSAETSGSETPDAEPSIAVLPFVNMSADPEQEYFSDGISEEILNVLVRVKGLQVASRTSSFTYKGENLDIPEIAKELKVGNIVEGSVRKAGNRVRITAQLIDTANDRHLWSDTFDRELTDIFAIQDEIAKAIVGALQEHLHIGLETVDVESTTQNLDAYDLYLKARSLFTARQNLATANQLFRQATQLDADFARAWEGLAASEWVSVEWLVGDGIDHDALAVAAAKRALELEASLSMPYAVLGMYGLGERPTDLFAAREDLDLALANDPKNATAWLWSSIFYKGLGYAEKAIADLERCLDIDPAYQNCKQHLAEAYLMHGDRERAMTLFTQTIEANFHSTDGMFIPLMTRAGDHLLALYMADVWTGGTYAPVIDWITALEQPEADHTARLQNFERWARENNDDLLNYPGILLALKAYDHFGTSGRMPWSQVSVLWGDIGKEFRGTPYFKQFVRALNMPAYWRKNGFPPQCQPVGEEDFECD